MHSWCVTKKNHADLSVWRLTNLKANVSLLGPDLENNYWIDTAKKMKKWRVSTLCVWLITTGTNNDCINHFNTWFLCAWTIEQNTSVLECVLVNLIEHYALKEWYLCLHTFINHYLTKNSVWNPCLYASLDLIIITWM